MKMKEIRKLTIICVLAMLIGGATADYVYGGQISRWIIFQPAAYAARWITYQVGGYIVIDGLTIYLNPGDQVITPAMLAQGTWEPLETSLFLDNVRPGDTVIDVGANIGYYTLVAARKVGPRGKVIAFEPDPESFSFLKRNVKANGLTNVVLEQKALSNSHGRLNLYLARENRGDHRIFPAQESRDAVEVEALPLDDYLQDSVSVNFIKIDTQGAEGVIVEGMLRTLRAQHDPMLVVEFWPYGLSRARYPATRLLEYFETLGYEIYVIDETLRKLSPVTTSFLLERYTVENEEFTNLLLTRDDSFLPPVFQRQGSRDPATYRLICGILTMVFLAFYILRRRKRAALARAIVPRQE